MQLFSESGRARSTAVTVTVLFNHKYDLAWYRNAVNSQRENYTTRHALNCYVVVFYIPKLVICIREFGTNVTL